MRRILVSATTPLVLLLAACATTDEGATSGDAGPGIGAVSSYGMFLAGEAALNEGRSGEAAIFFDKARMQAGENPLIAERAFTAAVLAGKIEKAAGLAPAGEEASEAGQRLGQLVIAVEALADGEGKLAYDLLAGDGIGFPHRSAAVLLAPWAAAQAGDVEGSLVRPQVRGDRIVEYFGQLGQGHLFERARRYDEAETDFKAAMAMNPTSEMGVMAYGGFLERRGRRKEALALYDAFLAQQSTSVAIRSARASAAAGKAAPRPPTIRQGAARAIVGPAATMIAARQTQFALAYLRLALRLDPERDEAWLMVGDIMQAAGDTGAAREAYGRLEPGSLEYPAAQAKLAWTYQTAGDSETALKLAREAAASGGVNARLTLADLLRSNERYAEAAELLTELVEEAKAPDWRLFYARGVSYERLGRWPEAEADLVAALELRPDEPELLNYLGYSWIDRGVRLEEAMAMVEKAVAANPGSGAMVDSLGWAYYRLGDYEAAVETLEQAVELEAGDPEINNHLGDAYWKVGRRDEARFQWRRVLTLDPEARIRADAEAKLASGLGPDGPAPQIAAQ